MANRVIATLDIACWKEHECCSCGTTFRYLFKRKQKGAGVNEDQARDVATRAAVKSIKSQVELQPCPTCGLYQPDMVGSWRSRRHIILTCVSVALFAILFALSLDHEIRRDVPLWGALGVAGVTLLGHFLIAGWRFNQDQDRNRATAQQAIEAGRLQVTAAYSSSGDEDQDVFRQGGAIPVFLLMLLATAVIPAAEYVRRSQDWPWNTVSSPPVAGPGDRTTVWFPQKIQAIKRIWNGTVTARILNANELGLARDSIHAETSTATWGNEIWIDDKAKDPNVLTSPWVQLTIPDIPQPREKKLQVQMDLELSYPTARGTKEFEVLHNEFKHTVTLTLAPPRAGALFVQLWWIAGLGGSILVVIAGLFLTLRANWLSARALPTRVFPLDEMRSDREGLAPSLLVASARVQVSREHSEFTPQEFSDEKLNRGARRTRIWLWIMILCMVLGCSGVITAPLLLPGRNAADIPAIISVGLIVVGLGGTVLFARDLIRYRREQRSRQSREEEE